MAGYRLDRDIIVQEWEDMRRSGMSVEEIAQKVHKSRSTILAHIQYRDVYVRNRKDYERVIELYQQDYTYAEIVDIMHIKHYSVEYYVDMAIKEKRLKKRPNGWMLYAQHRRGVTQAVISPDDDCQKRELRGLSDEEYKRLLEVNREYDRVREIGWKAVREERDESNVSEGS